MRKLLILLLVLKSSFASWQLDMQNVEEGYLLSEDTIEKNSLLANSSEALRRLIGLKQQENLFYDPVLWTMGAGVESKLKKYTEGIDWKEIVFSKPKYFKKTYYQKEIQGYFREEKSSDTLIIIKGSSYSTWKSQTWVGKTVDTLLGELGGINIIAFSGFLTAEYMKASPLFPDTKGDIMASDIYSRLVEKIELINQTRSVKIKKIGLIGFSGGGSEIISLLNIDRKNFFNLGGIAFSPVLSQKVVFDNLDTYADNLWENHQGEAIVNAGFTTFFNKYTMNLLLKLISYDKPKKKWYELRTTTSDIHLGIPSAPMLSEPKISLLMKKSLKEESKIENMLKHVFFNEFVVVDLRTTIEEFALNRVIDDKTSWLGSFVWVGNENKKEKLITQGNRHRDFWGSYALEMRRRYTGIKSYSINQLMDSKDMFKYVNNKLYVVFSQDDPVLSNGDFHNKESFRYFNINEEITNVIKDGRQNENVRIFNPVAGGHMGYFLDTPWLKKTIRTFFRKQN